MPYFTYTRLKICLDLLPVIGFQHFTALWKAYNKSKHITPFCTVFFHRHLYMEFAHFEFFLNAHFIGFKIFANVFVHLNLLGEGLFKNI